MQQHEYHETPRLRTKVKISLQRRPADSRGQGEPKRPARAKKSVSCESVDKNHKLDLRGPRPPGGPQDPKNRKVHQKSMRIA